MRKPWIFIYASLFPIIFLYISCTAGRENQSVGDRSFFIIKSFNSGSYYSAASAWARLITSQTRYLGVNSTAPAGDNEKILMLDGNRVQAAVIKGPEAKMAYNGEPVNWKKPMDIRALFALWPASYCLIASGESSIHEMEDIKGKRIAIYSEKTANGDMLEYLLGLYGIDSTNTTIYRVRESIGVMMLMRGETDCIWYNPEYGEVYFKELNSETGFSRTGYGNFRFVPVRKNSITSEFLKVYPYFYIENSCLYTSCFTACSSRLSDDEAYNLTRLWWENIDFVKQYIPDMVKYINTEDNRKGIPVPFHRGSLRYMREAGLIPEKSQNSN